MTAGINESGRLRLAIQKEGRLTDYSLTLLRSVGLEFDSYKQRLLSRVRNFDLDILYSRDDDIPSYLASGTVDLAVIGQNLLFEEGVGDDAVIELLPLGFGQCRLVVAVPKESGISSPRQLVGQRVATSYPRSAKRYFDNLGVAIEPITISGAVEMTPSLGIAQAIVEITATGSGLIMHDLVAIADIMQSEAVLAVNARTYADPDKRRTIERLMLRIRAAHAAKNYKYLMMNAPEASLDRIRAIVPGLKSPTVIPIATPGWVAVHTVVKEEVFWDIMEQLREAGAGEILVVPIEKILL